MEEWASPQDGGVSEQDSSHNTLVPADVELCPQGGPGAESPSGEPCSSSLAPPAGDVTSKVSAGDDSMPGPSVLTALDMLEADIEPSSSGAETCTPEDHGSANAAYSEGYVSARQLQAVQHHEPPTTDSFLTAAEHRAAGMHNTGLYHKARYRIAIFLEGLNPCWPARLISSEA